MPLLVTLGEVRDVVIIVWGIIGALFFAVALIVALMIGFTSKGLLNSVKAMLDDSLKPALTSVKDAADTVRGTTEFVGRTAVTPVVRAYGTFAGVKKGLGVLTSFKGKK
jgi:hypothetical protein